MHCLLLATMLPRSGGLLGMRRLLRPPPCTSCYQLPGRRVSSATAEAQPADDDPYIFDVDDDSFLEKVLQVQHKTPIIVDCHASWCGPCKTLTPLLESVVRSYEGGVLLAKMDVDEAPQIAAQMQVKQVPTVVAFKHGPVGEGKEGMTIAGVMPAGVDEPTMRRWIEDTLEVKVPEANDTPEALMDSGTAALSAGDARTAMEKYNACINAAVEAENLQLQASAAAGLLHCYMMLEAEEPMAAKAAEAVANSLKEPPLSQHAGPAVAKALASYAMATELASIGDPKELEALAAGGDLSAQIGLAKLAFSSGNLEGAFTQTLAVMKEDPSYEEGVARRTMLEFFEIVGHIDPTVTKYRKRMANLIFV